MKTHLRKIRIRNWAIALLAVVNVAALSSFIVAKISSAQQTAPLDPDCATEVFLMENVGFDDVQMTEYRELKAQYDQRTMEIRAAMHQSMSELLKETASESADMAAIDSVANIFGSRQAELKKETIRHMIHLKQLCRPHQRERFNATLSRIENRGMGPGHGRGMGRGMGRGRGMGNQPCFEN